MMWLLSILLFWPTLAQADTVLPTVTSFSTDFISVTSQTPYTTTIAIYGTDLGYLLDDSVTVTLGALAATEVAGNSTGMNLTFTLDSSSLTPAQADYPIVISDNGVVMLTTTDTITLYNPYQLTATPSQPKQFLNTTRHPHKRNKETIGLNVHWALGSDSSFDDLYAQDLSDSHTTWAREHFSFDDLMGSDSAAWLKRYDEMMLNYQADNIHVVGMLAYGNGNLDDWETFVSTVVQRYGNYVDAWEIWNEPDSPTYLEPHHNWATYRPILKAASVLIHQYDPDAIVLNGAVANITNESFLKHLLIDGKNYFDELNVHVYYCTSLDALEQDWVDFERLVKKYRPTEKIWITELGCSTGTSGVTNKSAKDYLKSATKLLLSYDNLRPIFLYTIRDRDLSDDYEAEFGLLHLDGSTKPSWRWYTKLPVN